MRLRLDINWECPKLRPNPYPNVKNKDLTSHPCKSIKQSVDPIIPHYFFYFLPSNVAYVSLPSSLTHNVYFTIILPEKASSHQVKCLMMFDPEIGV
jgi:hypothetical protein